MEEYGVGAVYIMTNVNDTVLYVGVTSELWTRVFQHKTSLHVNSFTTRYKVCKLVYYCYFFNMEDAIREEKRLKAGSRLKKIKLINEMNPEWKDLDIFK